MEGYPIPLPTARTEKGTYSEEEIRELSGCLWPAGRKEREIRSCQNCVSPFPPWISGRRLLYKWRKKSLIKMWATATHSFSHGRLWGGEREAPFKWPPSPKYNNLGCRHSSLAVWYAQKKKKKRRIRGWAFSDLPSFCVCVAEGQWAAQRLLRQSRVTTEEA